MTDDDRNVPRLRTARRWTSTTGLIAAFLLCTPATAQIVPETSGSPAAAFSPAAAVQTGSRANRAAPPCERRAPCRPMVVAEEPHDWTKPFFERRPGS